MTQMFRKKGKFGPKIIWVPKDLRIGTKTLGTSIGHVNLSPIVLSLKIPAYLGTNQDK